MIANRLANPRFSSPQVDIHELCKSGALQIYKRLALNKYTSFTAQTSAEKQYDFNTTTIPAATPPHPNLDVPNPSAAHQTRARSVAF